MKKCNICGEEKLATLDNFYRCGTGLAPSCKPCYISRSVNNSVKRKKAEGEKPYYVYEWFFKDTGKPFYVGKGRGRRLRETKDKSRSMVFINYVKKFKCDSRKIIEGLTEEEAFKEEVRIIALYRENGINLINKTDGGDGFPPRYGSENHMSKKVVQLTLDGKFIKSWDCIMDVQKDLNITGSAITECCKGKRGRKSFGGFLWIYEDDYNPNKKYVYEPKTNSKAIVQYRLDGSFVKEWESATKASLEIGVTRSKICSCAKGAQKTCAGYLWKYKDENGFIDSIEVEEKTKNRVPTPIVQLGLDGTYIAAFPNASSAAEKVSGTWRNNKNILLCCKGNRNTAMGFKWMYEYDYLTVKE